MALTNAQMPLRRSSCFAPGGLSAGRPTRIVTRLPLTTNAPTNSLAFRPEASCTPMIEHLPATTSSHGSPVLPALIAAAGEHASLRFLEFFVANRDGRTESYRLHLAAA